MEKKEFKERLNYVKNPVNPRTGKGSFTVSPVNYPLVFQADDEEEMKSIGKAMIGIWLNHAKELLTDDEPFELKELTGEEWEAKDDNIDYWEIERMKRILNRPSVQKLLIPELAEVLGDESDAIFAISTIIATKAHERK